MCIKGVFGQLLNLSALFLAISVYLRHRQIVEFYWHQYRQVGKWRGVSCGLLWLGYTSAFGVSLVANFQVDSPDNSEFVLNHPCCFRRAMSFTCTISELCCHSDRGSFIPGLKLYFPI